MMSRVFIICMFIIQLLCYWMLKTYSNQDFTIAFWQIFQKYKILLIYLGIINFITFTVFALDKIKAIKGEWRYRIVSLLGLCFIGGSIGGLLAMHIFKHKTKVPYFTIGIPLIILTHIVILIFVINVIKI